MAVTQYDIQGGFHTMKKLEYQITFNSPAFLGNAAQTGQWRTPPFKALLRQWWRVAVAYRYAYDHKQLREAEGRLLGNAWLEGNFCKSQVRLRLDHWNEGKLKREAWEPLSMVPHPYAKASVHSDVYLGFGPVDMKTKTLKENAAIQAGETAILRLAVPDAAFPDIQQAIALMDAYGSLGGRSRNGWGGISVKRLDASEDVVIAPKAYRPFSDALSLDWPHAIGLDDDQQVLAWSTGPLADWKGVLATLAKIKLNLRAEFRLSIKNNQPSERHWLSYPVKDGELRAWKDLRIPNSLRFKVRPAPENAKKVIGVIFHVPCLPTPEAKKQTREIHRVWQKAHNFLDRQDDLQRSRV